MKFMADKVHGWDNAPIRMVQLCGKERVLPLELQRHFPGGLEKTNYSTY